MEQSLKEQLAAAHAEFQAIGQEQQKRSEASSKVNDEIARLNALKDAAAAADEHAAQVSAQRHLGEATDADAQAAREAAESATAAAAGVERAIAQLQREAELLHGRHMSTLPNSAAAQNVCNQLRAAILHESANEAAIEYLEAARNASAKLTALLGHAKAVERIPGAEPFTRHFYLAFDVPAFPMLAAFRPHPHHRLKLESGVNGEVDRAAGAIVGKLRDDGYAF